MALTVASFRADFPEFNDGILFPDAVVTTWMAVATTLFQDSLDRWGTLLQTAQELATAHYLVLSARDRSTKAVGGIPGEVRGLATAEAVDSVSVSYDVQTSAPDGGGNWNATSYGQRLFQLMRLMGAGASQL